MIATRHWAMPSGNTFEIAPIANFVRKWTKDAKVIVDPFARNSTVGTITNDLDPETEAQFHMDAADFCGKLEQDQVVADVVIFDPPYSPRQISELYKRVKGEATSKDTQNSSLYARVRKPLARILKTGGIALSFGWNSSGVANWPIIECMLVCHGSAHNDTICIAQQKPLVYKEEKEFDE